MGVICSFEQAMAVVGCFLVGGKAVLNFDLLIQLHFIFQLRVVKKKVVSCADIRFLVLRRDLHVKRFLTEGDVSGLDANVNFSSPSSNFFSQVFFFPNFLFLFFVFCQLLHFYLYHSKSRAILLILIRFSNWPCQISFRLPSLVMLLSYTVNLFFYV